MLDDERQNICEYCGADLGCTGQAHFSDCPMHPVNRAKRQFNAQNIQGATICLHEGLLKDYHVHIHQRKGGGYDIEWIPKKRSER